MLALAERSETYFWPWTGSTVGPYLPSGLMPKVIQLLMVEAVMVHSCAFHVVGAEAGAVSHVNLTSTAIFSAREIASCASLSLTVGLRSVKVPPVSNWLGGLIVVRASITGVAIRRSSKLRPAEEGVKLNLPSLAMA